MLLHLLALGAVATCGAEWEHRALPRLRPVVWPLANLTVPDFSSAQQDTPEHLQPQIIGGNDAQPGEFPHQVSMQITGAPYATQHICGGSLIASQWVLTAAHCAWGVPEYTSVFVLAGKTHLNEREAGQMKSIVSDMYAHKKYRTDWNRGVGPFDVALLKLITPILESDTIKYAKLPVDNAIPTGTATLSGWGIYNKAGEAPMTLQTAAFPITTFEACNALIDQLDLEEPDFPEVNPLRNTNVCTGPLDKPGLSSCQGDSGGPLVQPDSTSTGVVVVGIVSWGFTPCGDIAAPSVFTRVSAYNTWIADTMKEHA